MTNRTAYWTKNIHMCRYWYKMVNTTWQNAEATGTQQVTLFQFQRPCTGWDPYW